VTLTRYLVPCCLFSVVHSVILYYIRRVRPFNIAVQRACYISPIIRFTCIGVSFLLFCLLYKVKGAAADCHNFHMSDSSTTSTSDEDTDLLQFIQGLGGQGRNRSLCWRTAVLAACLVQRSYRQHSFRRRAR
jgi:hypothetical protein